MTDFFFQMGLSNACFSLALAIVAMVVGAKARRPHLARMLWLLVFIKLVTPPIVTIPIVTIPQQPETAVAINEHSRPGPPLANSREFDVDAQPAASVSSRIGSVGWNHGKEWLASIWLLGSVVVFAWSMVRVCRFSRLLAAESDVAPQELQTAAVKIARRLRLNTIPMICTTSTRLSPMVWWTGGKVRIVIPTTLLDQMDAHEWQWVLAHEMAHVRRRDYLVRWLEWLACVLFWWNPVVWWAQRNLRTMEEICCDELVISCLNPKPKFYADSLLSAVEFLARPVLRPPAMASEINSGGFLERRFKMIVSETPKRSNTRWLQACVLLCAMVVLPLGIASAQDYKAVERQLGEAVSKGELKLEHAGVMMNALRRVAQQDERKSITREDYARAEAGLKKAVAEGKISEEDLRARLNGMRRAMAGQGERAKDDEIKGHFNRMGVSDEDFGRIKRHLYENGVKREQLDEVMGVIVKVIHEMKSEGEHFELDPRIRDHFKREVDLTDEQIEFVQGIARRVLQGRRERSSDTREDKRAEYEAFERRIYAAVEACKMTRREAGEKLEGYRRRMSMANRDGGEDKEYEAIIARIRVAVAEGKMTREKAAARIEAYKKSVGRGRQAEDEDKELDYDAIGRRIRAAVAAGEMTEEEARAKWEAIKKKAAAKDKDDD